MRFRSFALVALSGAALVLVNAPAGAAQAAPTLPLRDSALTTAGSVRPLTPSDPVIPGPKIVRPKTASCTVTLGTNIPFDNFTPYVGSYAPPPSCAGPWSKVVLDFNVSVMGIQYDRLGAIWIGGTEIFHFTTSEPPGPQISWHVEKDVTEYTPTLSTAQPFTISLGNLVNQQYTGVYYVTATLTFYATGPHWPAAVTPDAVLPISEPSGSPPWFTLNTPSNTAQATLSLPTNIEDAQLEVYTTGHGCDEFWYAQESTAYEQSIGQTCGGTAYREVDVYVDSMLAGVIIPYPYVYTGGIDPSLWLPITGHDTLGIPPYLVDLGPFVGILTDGQPHTIAISVDNNFGYWVADADLLLTEDHGSATTSGKLTALSSGPKTVERYNESRLNSAGGSAEYRAEHHVSAAGYVDTSHGRINTSVDQTWSFADHQRFTNAAGYYFYIANTAGTTVKRVANHGKTETITTALNYPFAIRSPQTGGLTIDQAWYQTVSDAGGRHPLLSTAQAQIHAKAGGGSTTTTEHYDLTDTNGYCYDQLLSATDRVLQTNKVKACRH